MPAYSWARKILPDFLSSANAPRIIPGTALSGAFGAPFPSRSVLHQPGSTRLIITSDPSTVVPKFLVTLSKAAHRLVLSVFYWHLSISVYT